MPSFAAGHMIWEGMVKEGLAVTRAIHDRYHAGLRNAYNEIECSDHYARSMASYGVYLAACGYEYHGPNGYLAFSPRLSPDDFKAAFTAAEGWGSLTQTRTGSRQTQRIAVHWGTLTLQTLGFDVRKGQQVKQVTVRVANQPVDATHHVDGQRVTISLSRPVTIQTDQSMTIAVT